MLADKHSHSALLAVGKVFFGLKALFCQTKVTSLHPRSSMFAWMCVQMYGYSWWFFEILELTFEIASIWLCQLSPNYGQSKSLAPHCKFSNLNHCDIYSSFWEMKIANVNLYLTWKPCSIQYHTTVIIFIYIHFKWSEKFSNVRKKTQILFCIIHFCSLWYECVICKKIVNYI